MFICAANNANNATQLSWSEWLSIIAIIVSAVSAYISLRQNRKLHNDSKNFELIETRRNIYNRFKKAQILPIEDIEIYFNNEKLIADCKKFSKLLNKQRKLNFDKSSYKGHLREQNEEDYNELVNFENAYLSDISEDIDRGAKKEFQVFCDKHEFFFKPFLSSQAQNKNA